MPGGKMRQSVLPFDSNREWRSFRLTRPTPCSDMHRSFIAAAILLAVAQPSDAQLPSGAELQRRIDAITPKVVAWRRDIHQHPELGNREFRTAKLVADHLTALGIEVQTGIAHTGVVGILRGGKPGDGEAG